MLFASRRSPQHFSSLASALDYNSLLRFDDACLRTFRRPPSDLYSSGADGKGLLDVSIEEVVRGDMQLAVAYFTFDDRRK